MKTALFFAITWLVLFAKDLFSQDLVELLNAVMMSVFMIWAPLMIRLLSFRHGGSQTLGRYVHIAAASQIACAWFEHPWWPLAIAFIWPAYLTLIASYYVGKRQVKPAVALLLGIIGAAWWCASQLGTPIFAFPFTMVLLTAVHFHVAGMGVLVLMISGPKWAPNWLFFAYVVTVAAMALAISTQAHLEVWPALVIVALLSHFGFMQIRNCGAELKPWMWLSSICLWIALAIAFRYAYGQWQPSQALDWHFVASTHGLLQVFGFVGCGLLARLKYECSPIVKPS